MSVINAAQLAVLNSLGASSIDIAGPISKLDVEYIKNGMTYKLIMDYEGNITMNVPFRDLTDDPKPIWPA